MFLGTNFQVNKTKSISSILIADSSIAISHDIKSLGIVIDDDIDTRYFWIREKQIDGDLKVEHISGEKQVADIMTKPVSKPRFQKPRQLLGLKSIK